MEQLSHFSFFIISIGVLNQGHSGERYLSVIYSQQFLSKPADFIPWRTLNRFVPSLTKSPALAEQ